MTRPPGRPRTRWGTTKLTTIHGVIAAGGSFPQAAAAVGVSSKTLQRHRRDDPRVAAAVSDGVAARQAPPVDHGRPATYRRGCRCRDCRAANTAYYRARRQRETPATQTG